MHALLQIDGYDQKKLATAFLNCAEKSPHNLKRLWYFMYVQVIVSNTALNSTGALIEVTPWPLVPPPVLVNKTNTTIAVKLVLNDSQLYEPITDVSVKVMIVQWCMCCRCDQLTFSDMS